MLVTLTLLWSLIMADDPRFTEFERASPQTGFLSSSSGAPNSPTTVSPFRQRMIDRQYSSQIRDIANDRGLMGTRRRASMALATAERRAPRNPNSVNRPVSTPSIRLLQEAVDNPRLRGGARKALIAGAAELGGRPDITEDLTLGRGLRSVRARPSYGPDDGFDAVGAAAAPLRALQRQGLRQPRIQVPDQNQANQIESTFQETLTDLDDIISIEGGI